MRHLPHRSAQRVIYDQRTCLRRRSWAYAIGQLLAGRSYDPNPLDIDEAVVHIMAASARIAKSGWALQVLKRLAANAATDVILSARLKSRLADMERGRV